MKYTTPAFAGILALVALAAAPAPAAAQESGIGLPVGSMPKPVVLEDLSGHPFDLATVIGKQPVLLEFWAEWCPLCKALEPELAKAHAKFGDRVAFIQVAVAVNEDPASIRKHLAEHPSPARVLWDAHGAAVRAFEAPATSYTVLLDASGRVVYTGAGEDQKLTELLARTVGTGTR